MNTIFAKKKTIFKPEKKGKKCNPGKENNSLIYTFDENQSLDMYVIKNIIDDDTFECFIQGKFNLKHPLTPEYNWSHVGVYRVGPLSEEIKIVKRSEISGKVLKINGYLITCPNNVLHEQ